MSTRIRTPSPRCLGIAAVTVLLTLGASSQALARDHDGYRDHDRGHRYGHRDDRGHHRGRHHRKHHDYGYEYRYGHHDHYYRERRHYGYPYGAYGLGVLTGYLLSDY